MNENGTETPPLTVVRDTPAPKPDLPTAPKFGTTTQAPPPRDSKPKPGSRFGSKNTATKAANPSRTQLPPGAIAKGMAEMYGLAGMAVGAMFCPDCGTGIAVNAQAMGESLEAAAKDNPALQKFFEGLLTASTFGQVIAAHAPMVMTIAGHKNHKKPSPHSHTEEQVA